ncbi:MAG: hypothetical protein U0412_06595 [Nitrospira sp.]
MMINKLTILSLLGILCVVSGCQTNPVKTAGIDNPGFMSLWGTYTQCRSTSDISEAQTAMTTLSGAAQTSHQTDSFVLPLPQQLERYVTTPTNRLAVDVRAMAAACSLHTGQVALGQGRVDLAKEALTGVITLHGKTETESYYVSKASKLLEEIENGIKVSLQAH